ncbi:MAG: peptidylprolyl isomerase [Syntrophobacteraceae bacterium]
MAPLRISILRVCMILACVLSFATARAEMVDRIVANVNGEIILYSDLQNQVKTAAQNMPMLDVTDPSKKAQIEHDILVQMIRQKLADMEAERLKVTVANPEVDLRVQQVLEQNHATMAQLEANLKAKGQTLDKFREQIKKDMERDRLVERVCKSKVVISDQQVEAFLRGEKGDAASTSQKVHLGLIILPVGDKYAKPEEAEKTGREILEKLKGGADFQSLAKQYSKGPAAQEGGDLGYLATDELAPYIAQGIRNLKKDQVSGLVQGPGGYFIIKIFDIDTKKVSQSDPVLREKVRRTLYEQEVNRKFEEWVHDLESKAFIQISL